jgi:hypothetical protein
VQKAIGGYRADLLYILDLETRLWFAAHSHVAYIRQVDQAYYRIQGAKMTVQRVLIIDLQQPQAALEALLATFGHLIRDSEILLCQGNEKVAEEDLWRARGAFRRRRLQQASLAELVNFARSAAPNLKSLPEYWGLQWRRCAGADTSFLLRPIMVAATGAGIATACGGRPSA